MPKRPAFLSLLLVAALMLAACAEAPAGEASMEETPADMSGKVVVEAGGMICIGGSFALTGPIPTLGLDIRQGAELDNLKSLTHLYPAGNRLRGCLPAAWRNVAQNDVANLGLPFCAASSATDAAMAGAADRKMLVASYPAAEPGMETADNEGNRSERPNSTNKSQVSSLNLRG